MAQPPSTQPSAEGHFSIPTGYGEDRVVLMVKDPWWLFAYWEVQPGTERAVRGQLLPQEVPGLQTILRVYDVTGVDFPSQPAHHSFDVSLSGLATNWYIHTNAPNRAFIVEIGFLTNTGRFLLLARSNRVTTPRFGPSDIIDEAWMTTDETYWKLFGAAGIGLGSSPASWATLMAQRLSLGGWSSMGTAGQARPATVKGFWCRVDAELAIHGATEPKATVTIQGQPVTVRKDGTFSTRLAIPAGSQTLTIDVTASDGQHTRTLTPVVALAWAGTLTPNASTSTPSLTREQEQPRSRERGKS